MLVETVITVRLCEARESFIYTVRVGGLIEDTKEVVLKIDGLLNEETYHGGSEVLD